jgi:twinkle protein
MGKPTGFSVLNSHFTWRFGHTIALNGYPNNGKTVFAFNLMILSAMLYDWKWAAYCPENYPTSDLYSMMMEIYSGKTMELGIKNRITRSDMVHAKSFLKKHFILINNENGFTPEELRSLTKQLIMQTGIIGMYKDPWNALNHRPGNMTLDAYLEQELSAEVRMSVNSNIINLIAVHPPTPRDEDRKNPPAPSMFQITGGGVWSKKIYDILCVHIHNKEDIKDTSTEIHVQKTKWHKLVGLPTRNAPVILNFNRFNNRYNQAGVDPFNNDPDNNIPVNQMEIFDF